MLDPVRERQQLYGAVVDLVVRRAVHHLLEELGLACEIGRLLQQEQPVLPQLLPQIEHGLTDERGLARAVRAFKDEQPPAITIPCQLQHVPSP